MPHSSHFALRRWLESRRKSVTHANAQQHFTLVGGSALPDAPEHHDIPAGLEDVILNDGDVQADGLPAVLTYWLFQGDTTPQIITPKEVTGGLAQDVDFVWIDASSYTAQDIRSIAEELQLHRTTIHTICSPWHRPWLTVTPTYFFLSTNVARLNATTYQIQTGELDLCVSSHFLLSAHTLPLPFMARVQARAQQSPALITNDATFLLYIILDELLAYYEALNRHIQVESERLEESALHDTPDTFLEDLIHFKRYIFALTELVAQHREVFAAFFRPDFAWISGEDSEGNFRELQTRLENLLVMLSTAKEAVNGAFTIYVSQMAHRTNEIIKVLTMVSTVLLPLTVIIALFGTSIQSLAPKLGGFWFGLMLLTVLLLSCGILWLFRRQQWFTLGKSRVPQKLL